jgi:hypothetical protein
MRARLRVAGHYRVVTAFALASAFPLVAVQEGGEWWGPTALTAYATFALALVTVGLAAAAWRSTRLTKRTLDIAQEQADTAQKQAQTAEEAQRASLHPWLSLRDQPATAAAESGLLVSAAVQSLGPGWARIDRAHLVLPSGGHIALNPGVGMAQPGLGDRMTAVVRQNDPLTPEVASTEFPTLVVHCTDVHGEQGQTFEWVRAGAEWVMSARADEHGPGGTVAGGSADVRMGGP